MKRQHLAGFLVVGVLSTQSRAQTAAPRRIGALQRDLAALGFTEGRDIVFDERYADGRRDRPNEMAKKLVRGNADILVAHLTPAVRPAIFELGVNLQAARAMKLSVPQAVLTQADEIIE